MDAPIECAGVPRDLGVAQGRACADAVRRAVGAGGWLDRIRSDRTRDPLARDLWRHYPQLAERTAGIALGARVPEGHLIRALARQCGVRGAGLALAAEERSGPRLARVAVTPEASRDWIVRRSRPEAGIAAVEVTRPWLAAPFAGVNAAGLAAVASGFEIDRAGPPVPGFLLVEDCLQRFSHVDAAAEWCLKRPAGGRGTLLLADAAGAVAAVELARGERRVRVPEGGALAVGAPEALRDALAKACRDAVSAGLDVLGVARDALTPEAPGARAAWLDPAARRLGLGHPDGLDGAPVFAVEPA